MCQPSRPFHHCLGEPPLTSAVRFHDRPGQALESPLSAENTRTTKTKQEIPAPTIGIVLHSSISCWTKFLRLSLGVICIHRNLTASEQSSGGYTGLSSNFTRPSKICSKDGVVDKDDDATSAAAETFKTGQVQGHQIHRGDKRWEHRVRGRRE